jgi:hypothetical protein
MVCSNSASEGPVPGSLGGVVDLVNCAGEALELAHQRAHNVSARGHRLATVERAPRAGADARGVIQREAAGARILGRAADRPGIGVGQVLGRGEPREDAARPGRQQIAEDGAVLRQHHVELRDELSLVVLAVGHEPGAQARELAQALDLLVGHVTGLGRSRPQQARDDVSIDVIRLGLAADDVTIAPGLQRIQHDDPVARPAERRFQVFPEVARGLQPDQRTQVGLRSFGALGATHSPDRLPASESPPASPNPRGAACG